MSSLSKLGVLAALSLAHVVACGDCFAQTTPPPRITVSVR